MAEVIPKTTSTINLGPCLKSSCSELAISLVHLVSFTWLPWWLSGKESTCQCRRPKFDAWVGKIPWRKKWQPTPVFLPGESHRQKSLAGYSPQGCKVRHDWSDWAGEHSDEESGYKDIFNSYWRKINLLFITPSKKGRERMKSRDREKEVYCQLLIFFVHANKIFSN